MSSSQVNLTWTAATDDVGVTGYRVERCSGSGCSNFAQVGTPTGTSFDDAAWPGNTTYQYRVRAVDAAGNLGPYSAVVQVRRRRLLRRCPLGWWRAIRLTPGRGRRWRMCRGTGIRGRWQGTSWSTQGRYGGAMSFDGSKAWCGFSRRPRLDCRSAMTLSAWINPAVRAGRWRAILQRQPDAYFLNASNDRGPLRPAGGGTFGSDISYVGGSTASPVGVVDACCLDL